MEANLISHLDTPALVMDIMISGIIRRNALERIPGQSITTMIIDSLDCRTSEKPHSLAGAHSSKLESNTSSKRVQKKTFERMII